MAGVRENVVVGGGGGCVRLSLFDTELLSEKEVVSGTQILEVVNGEAVYLILHCHHHDPDPGGGEWGGCIPNPALSPPP